MAIEQPVGLQADTLSTPASVRMITAYVVVNGLLTPVQMQVIALADSTGAILSDLNDLTDPTLDVLAELREIRILISKLSGELPLVESINTHVKR